MTTRDESKRALLLVVVLATLLLVAATIGVWLRLDPDNPTAPNGPAQTPAQATQQSASVPSEPNRETREREQPTPANSFGNDEELSSIRLRILSATGDRPTPGIEVLLLPPLEGASWSGRPSAPLVQATTDPSTQRSQAQRKSSLAAEEWKDYAWTQTTDAKGEVAFRDLPPRQHFQLCILSPGAYEFEARSHPLRRDGSTLALGRGFDPGSLNETHISGAIPTTPDAETLTVARRHLPASVSVRLRDQVQGDTTTYIGLQRSRNSVRWTVASRRNVDQATFAGLMPGSGYKISGWRKTGHRFSFFTTKRFALREDESRDLGILDDIDPRFEHRVSTRLLAVTGEELSMDEVFKVCPRLRLSAYRRKPLLSCHLETSIGPDFWLVGMPNLFVGQTSIVGQEFKAAWGPYEVREVRVGPQHSRIEIVVAPPLSVSLKSVTLQAPKGYRYTSGSIVKFYEADTERKVGSTYFPLGSLEETCYLPEGALRARIQSEASDPDRWKKSRRFLYVTIRDGVRVLLDPGPPNGEGVETDR